MIEGLLLQDGEGILETSKTHKDLGELGSKKAILLEVLDFGMLDFMNWYELDLYVGYQDNLKISFAFSGRGLTKDNLKKIPVLNKKGYVIDFDLRNSNLIEEEVNGMDMKGKFIKC